MKIGILGSVPWSLIFGGGETMQLYTLRSLQRAGVDVSLYDFWDVNYRCDILHVFGCHPACYHTTMLAKQRGIKIALATISYNPDPGLLYGVWRRIDPLLPVKTTFRMNREMVAVADVLLPNSEAEAEFMIRFFGADPKRIRVIPNAAETRFASATPDAFVEKFGLRDFVLCVGKIEPRKNQLKLAQALAGTGIPLIFIGRPIPQAAEYYRHTMNVINANSSMCHMDALPADSDLLGSAFAACKVHALLGRNETPGIVSLEAALAGANIVAGECPPVREYLGDLAEFCDPDSPTSVRSAISRALEKPRSPDLRQRVLSEYTWDVAARKNIEAYRSIL